MIRTLKSNVLIILSIFTLIACEFQLRGSIEANFDSIQIKGGSAKFLAQLKKRVKQSGITIVNSNGEITLEILEDKIDKSILSLNSSGRVSEYELLYKMTFRFKNQTNKQWGEPISMDLRREYTYDDENIIAKDLEEKQLISGMQDELIRAITAQINTHSR